MKKDSMAATIGKKEGGLQGTGRHSATRSPADTTQRLGKSVWSKRGPEAVKRGGIAKKERSAEGGTRNTKTLTKERFSLKKKKRERTGGEGRGEEWRNNPDAM